MTDFHKLLRILYISDFIFSNFSIYLFLFKITCYYLSIQFYIILQKYTYYSGTAGKHVSACTQLSDFFGFTKGIFGAWQQKLLTFWLLAISVIYVGVSVARYVEVFVLNRLHIPHVKFWVFVFLCTLQYWNAQIDLNGWHMNTIAHTGVNISAFLSPYIIEIADAY